MRALKVKYLRTLEEFNSINETAEESYYSIETADSYEDVTGAKYYDASEVYDTVKEIKKSDKEFIGETGKYYAVLNAESNGNLYKLYGNVRKYKGDYIFTPIK